MTWHKKIAEYRKFIVHIFFKKKQGLRNKENIILIPFNTKPLANRIQQHKKRTIHQD